MATQQEIQDGIDEIITGANYKANQMRPLLTSMLDFSSAGQTVVFPDLVADNTTLADTTLVLEYGVNIIVTSTSTNYACRLPLPTTGKRVVVVNSSSQSVLLFPSMAGGQINNYEIDAPATIPPDGKAYDFICIENPLPGAWVWSPPAISQLVYPEIEVPHVNGVATSAFGLYTGELTSSASAGVGGGNLLLTGGFATNLFPSVVTRIKCYTNILTADLASFFQPDAITAGFVTAYLDSSISSVFNAIMDVNLYGQPEFPPDSVQFAPTGALSSPAQIGDTDTMFTVADFLPNNEAFRIGTGGLFSTHYYIFKMTIPASAATKTYKFKYFIEYN